MFLNTYVVFLNIEGEVLRIYLWFFLGINKLSIGPKGALGPAELVAFRHFVSLLIQPYLPLPPVTKKTGPSI